MSFITPTTTRAPPIILRSRSPSKRLAMYANMREATRPVEQTLRAVFMSIRFALAWKKSAPADIGKNASRQRA